jgi:hypothetical protein
VEDAGGAPRGFLAARSRSSVVVLPAARSLIIAASAR